MLFNLTNEQRKELKACELYDNYIYNLQEFNNRILEKIEVFENIISDTEILIKKQ